MALISPMLFVGGNRPNPEAMPPGVNAPAVFRSEELFRWAPVGRGRSVHTIYMSNKLHLHALTCAVHSLLRGKPCDAKKCSMMDYLWLLYFTWTTELEGLVLISPGIEPYSALSRGDWVQTNRTDFTIPDKRVSAFTNAFEISYYSCSMSFWSVSKTFLYLKNHNNSLRKGDLWVYAVRSGSRSVFHCSHQHPAMIHHGSSSQARRSFSRAIFIHPSSRNVFNFLLFRIVLLQSCQIYYHQTQSPEYWEKPLAKTHQYSSWR